MYAEPVVIFQKLRKCFGGCEVIVYFKMEHKIQGQKYGQLINEFVTISIMSHLLLLSTNKHTHVQPQIDSYHRSMYIHTNRGQVYKQ